MGSSNAKFADIENGPYSPLRNKTLADAWAEHTWSNGKPGVPGGIRASQYVQPRQQIKRDFEEAQRVASMHDPHFCFGLRFGQDTMVQVLSAALREHGFPLSTSEIPVLTGAVCEAAATRTS